MYCYLRNTPAHAHVVVHVRAVVNDEIMYITKIIQGEDIKSLSLQIILLGGGGGGGVYTILVIGDWPVLFLVKREFTIFKNVNCDWINSGDW